MNRKFENAQTSSKGMNGAAKLISKDCWSITEMFLPGKNIIEKVRI